MSSWCTKLISSQNFEELCTDIIQDGFYISVDIP